MTKKKFCEELCALLIKTGQHDELVELEYQARETGEWVIPHWWDPINQRRYTGKAINVTADSMTAIIKDVLAGIE